MKNIFKYIIILFIILPNFSLAPNKHVLDTKTISIEGALVSESGDTLTFSHSLDSTASSKRIVVLDSTAKKNRPRHMHDPSQLDTILNSFKSESINSSVIDSTSIIIDCLNITSDTTQYLSFQASRALSNTTISPQSNYGNWINRESQLSNQYQLVSPFNTTIDYNKIKYNIAPLSKISFNTPSSNTSSNQLKFDIDGQCTDSIPNISGIRINRRNWLHSFNGSLQFSQAYISPNWYQGGNNNLNMLLNAEFDIKLNEKFHPNLLFETSIKYKLAMNSAPEDTIRNYSISDEIFQVNSKFGVRAAKRWFYSIQAQLKTQFFNGYKSNTNDLKAAFLSPGELNVGLGMTYNYANNKNTFTFDASISPLSYNLKSCTNKRMNETDFGIKNGRSFASQFGSSGEGKLKWNISHNIVLSSRLFVFTDYEYFQGDLENTLSFAINRFLSTQINVHLRYDSSTPRIEGSKWHKLQLKEILSFGFAYNFKNL